MHTTPTPAVSAPLPPGRARSRLGRFDVLPRLAGRSFLVIGLLARLPLAMLTVGALTLVTAESSSYAAGGFAAGAVGLGSALGAPLLGLLADQRGQRIVLLIAASLNTLALGGLLVTTLTVGEFTGTPLLAVLLCSVAVGFTCPQVGPLARVRWMAMTRSGPRSDLDTALSYEGTADEFTFVLGPALVGLLASLVAPWLPLALAAVLTITLVTAFAVHPTVVASDAASPYGHGRAVVGPGGTASASSGTDRVTHLGKTSGKHPGEKQDENQRGGARRLPKGTERSGGRIVLLPVLGMIAMGTFFGSTQAFLTAYAGTFGAAETSGLFYAVMGLSSAVAALSVAYWPAQITDPRRWTAAAAGMVVAAAALALPLSVPTMLGILFILGVFVGPTMVTIFSIGSAVAPGHRLGTVMTLLASGIVAGTAAGSAVAGALAESTLMIGSVTAAGTVPGFAAVLLLVLGGASAPILRRRSDG